MQRKDDYEAAARIKACEAKRLMAGKGITRDTCGEAVTCRASSINK
jgi:hypothetical protein